MVLRRWLISEVALPMRARRVRSSVSLASSSRRSAAWDWVVEDVGPDPGSGVTAGEGEGVAVLAGEAVLTRLGVGAEAEACAGTRWQDGLAPPVAGERGWGGGVGEAGCWCGAARARVVD